MLSRLHDLRVVSVFFFSAPRQPTVMSGNAIYTSTYSPYWWWEDNDNWLKATIIAAPVFAVLGAILISYRLYARRRTYIYTPPVITEDAVYKPTTCGLKRHKEIAVEVGPDSPSVIIEQIQPMLKPTQHEEDHLTPGLNPA